MPELTLHFEAAPGTDLNAAAAELQSQITHLNGVQSADVKAQRFQSVSAQEVLTVIQFATTFAENTAAFLTAIAAVREAWEKVKVMVPGLQPPTVEVGLKKIPIDQLTAAHAAAIISDQ